MLSESCVKNKTNIILTPKVHKSVLDTDHLPSIKDTSMIFCVCQNCELIFIY